MMLLEKAVIVFAVTSPGYEDMSLAVSLDCWPGVWLV